MSSSKEMAEERSTMSMMEYSGDFGGSRGGVQRDRERRDFSRADSLSKRGERWVRMSVGEGSSVRKNIPEFRSGDCGEVRYFERECVYGRRKITESAGRIIEGAILFLTSSRMFLIVCWSVRILSVRWWGVWVSVGSATVAELARSILRVLVYFKDKRKTGSLMNNSAV